MFTRRWIWLLLTCSLATVFGIWAYCSQREPTFEGRTLTSWLIEYENDRKGDFASANHMTAANAIRQIGTNALPLIIKWHSFKPPSWIIKLAPIIGSKRATEAYEKVMIKNLRLTIRARNALEILRTNATPAIPELIAIASKRSIIEGRQNTFAALNEIGRPGKIALSSLLQNPASPDRFLIANILSVGDVITNISIPALVGCLSDSDPQVRQEATNGLMRIAPDLLTNAPPQ